MLFRHIVIIGFVLSAGMGATAAHAQYRDGQPAVAGDGQLPYRNDVPQTLAPPPEAADPALAVRARFRSAYTRAKSPRIVVFWNREFTDEIGTKYDNVALINSRTDQSSSTRGAVASGYGMTVSGVDSASVSETSTTIRSGTDRATDNRRGSAYSEAIDFDIESAFNATLNGAGTRLVDRTSIMRTTGYAKNAGATSNVQGVETAAILGKADIVLEVVQLDDPRKPDGVSYRVIGRNVRSGKVLVTLSTGARPPARRMGYVAGADGGFVRATAPEPGPSDIGRQLAIETMAALSQRM